VSLHQSKFDFQKPFWRQLTCIREADPDNRMRSQIMKFLPLLRLLRRKEFLHFRSALNSLAETLKRLFIASDFVLFIGYLLAGAFYKALEHHSAPCQKDFALSVNRLHLSATTIE